MSALGLIPLFFLEPFPNSSQSQKEEKELPTTMTGWGGENGHHWY
jgi:hypothetical protein